MFLIDTTEEAEHLRFTRNYEDFRSLAIKLHDKQRYGDFHYSAHLAMVENALVSYGYDAFEYRAAAWLHDSMEDCGMTLARLQKLYGVKVSNMVYACTGVGANRKERNQCIYERLEKYPDAIPVKVADRFVNMRFSLATKSDKFKMYLLEFPEFAKATREHMCSTTFGKIFWHDLEDTYEHGKRLLGIVSPAPTR
jgi:guanosine-3',5'-bis(diphosphate) 3'-pyrophosphohydrolase